MITLPLAALLCVLFQNSTPVAPPAQNPVAVPAVPAAAAGPIVAVPASIDFGIVKPDELLTAKIKLLNPTDQPVTVVKAVPSCQCTGLDVVGKVIPAKGELEFSLSVKMSKAPVVKLANVQLVFDGGIKQVLRVDLKAESAYPIRSTPPFLDATDGKPLAGTYVVSAPDGKPFTIMSVMSEKPVFQGFDPAKDAPRTNYVVKYDFSDPNKRVPPYILIETDRDDCPIIDVRVRHATTKISPALKVAEFRSSFGKIAPGTSGTFELEIEKMASLRITGVRSLSDLAAVELTEQTSDGKNVVIHVKVTPAAGAKGVLFFPIELTCGAIKSQQLVFGLVR